MALVVETGSIVAGAEAYASVAAYKAYSDLYGVSYSAYTDAQIETYLRQATRYLQQSFRQRWKGVRVSSAQVLDFPRYGIIVDQYYAVASTTVPVDVVNANIILAQKVAAGTDLFPDATQKASQETIGPITVKYEQGSSQRAQFDAVEALLAPYLSSLGGVSVGLVKG